jgi:hypothetical protein
MHKLTRLSDGLLSFYCPGCKCNHAFDKRWTFDGNMEAPTFSPSLLVGPYWTMPPGWDYETAPRDEAGELVLAVDGIHTLGAVQVRCHSFVRAGMIEFLPDCTHELAGRTVPMVDVDA